MLVCFALQGIAAAAESSIPTAAWTDWAQAIGSIIGSIVAVVGLPVLIYQIVQLRQTIRAEAHGKVYENSLEVQKLLLDNPEFRPFFYEGATMEPTDERYPRLLAMAEIFTDYLEHIALQRENVPDEVKTAWDGYARFFLESSPIIRSFVAQHRSSYCRSFLDRIAKRTGPANPKLNRTAGAAG